MLGIDSTTGHTQVAKNACIWEPGEACSRLERWLQHLFGCVDYRQPCPSLKNLEALNWDKGKRKSTQKAQDTTGPMSHGEPAVSSQSPPVGYPHRQANLRR